MAAHIEKVRRQGRNFALVVVAEAVKDRTGQHVQQQHSGGSVTYGGIGHRLGDALAVLTGAETASPCWAMCSAAASRPGATA